MAMPVKMLEYTASDEIGAACAGRLEEYHG